MLHTCATKFDMTKNWKTFWILWSRPQDRNYSATSVYGAIFFGSFAPVGAKQIWKTAALPWVRFSSAMSTCRAWAPVGFCICVLLKYLVPICLCFKVLLSFYINYWSGSCTLQVTNKIWTYIATGKNFQTLMGRDHGINIISICNLFFL
jgi:hypothetical protein